MHWKATAWHIDLHTFDRILNFTYDFEVHFDDRNAYMKTLSLENSEQMGDELYKLLRN